MANKIIRDGEFLRDRHGGVFTSIGSDEERTKCYAVIVKCGHCGRGYYIPIMFTTRSNNVQNAIEDIKMTPRVKREKIDCVIDAFEITEREKFFIDAINDHDPYLKGYLEKESDLMNKRRIASHWTNEEDVKTAEQYSEFDVLARCFAPRKIGSRLVVPNRINKNELLQEFFKCATIRCSYDINKDPFFMLLYYMQYGKDNDLGIKFKDNVLSFKGKNGKGEILLDEKYMKFVDRYGINCTEQKEEYFSGKFDERKTPSPMDKFKARLDKFKKLSGQEEAEPGQ